MKQAHYKFENGGITREANGRSITIALSEITIKRIYEEFEQFSHIEDKKKQGEYKQKFLKTVYQLIINRGH